MTKSTAVRALAAAIAIASTTLSGCSGGGSALPHASNPASAGRTAEASFTIHWPQHAIASARTVQRSTPHFISPSALSVVVEVNPNASTPGPVTFANANGSSTSTVTVNAPVGNDEFVFTLWDKQQTAGEPQPVGNLLGQADVASQTIVAGQVNTVNATIGGVTSAIKIAPVAGQAFVEADPTTGYDIVGDQPATFATTAYDAGGNVIVAPGAPTLNFAPSGGSVGYVGVQPVSGNPNEFTVSALAARNSTTPYAVVVTATDSGVPHTTTGNISLFLHSAVYVSYGSGSGSRVAVYDDRGNAIALPASAFSGLTSPSGLAYSTKEHRLFVADSASNKVLAFDAAGNAVSGFTPPSLTGARGVEYDPQSDTVFATGTTQAIAFNPDGSAKTMPAGAFSHTATPDGIAYVGLNPTNGSADDAVGIANDATAAIDYYDATTGAYLSTDTLGAPAAAPIVGLTWNPIGNGSILVAAGGAAGAGFSLSTAPGIGFLENSTTSTTTRFGGVALAATVQHDGANPTQYELFVVETDANQIQGYIPDPFSGHYVATPDVVITTPATSGRSKPQGIAVAL